MKTKKYRTDQEFWDMIYANPAYKALDLPAEIGRMEAWIAAHPERSLTRQFVVSWLNRKSDGSTVFVYPAKQPHPQPVAPPDDPDEDDSSHHVWWAQYFDWILTAALPAAYAVDILKVIENPGYYGFDPSIQHPGSPGLTQQQLDLADAISQIRSDGRLEDIMESSWPTFQWLADEGVIELHRGRWHVAYRRLDALVMLLCEGPIREWAETRRPKAIPSSLDDP